MSDLSPLKNARLKELILVGCKQLKDYTPVLTLPWLERLHLDGGLTRHYFGKLATAAP